MAFNAYLTNSNFPLGTEFDDGLRVGPVLTRTIVSGTGPNSRLTPYSYQQWGQGLLLSSMGTYNIIPRGPSGAGNIAGYNAPLTIAGAGYLNLSADGYVTSSAIAGNGEIIIQCDWPRVPQLSILGNDIGADVTFTVFGTDCYGVPLQASVIANAEGDYSFLKAFYTITAVYSNGASGAATVQVQTTDTFGLPYKLNSVGDISFINWGDASDMSTSEEDVTREPTMGTTNLTSGGSTVVNTGAVVKGSNIQVSRSNLVGVAGIITAPWSTVVNNTSFEITVNSAETSAVNWLITNPPYVSGNTDALAGLGGVRFMEAGVLAIASTNVNANSIIHTNVSTFGTAHGAWRISNIEPQVSFTITSAAATETSSAEWAIMPQDWVSGTSANMVAGSVFVSTNDVTASSVILVSYGTIAGVPGVLSVPAATINADPANGPVGFVINSSSNTDTSTVNWTILSNVQGLTQGTGTLAAGTATINTASVEAASVILMCYNTPDGTQGTWLDVTARVAGTSFTVQSKTNANVLANLDTSTFNWVIFPLNMPKADFATPLGTFVPADERIATAYTGDVRGTYTPSTPANGLKQLHFGAFIDGFDAFVDQQADAQLPGGGSSSTDLQLRSAITIDDQVGVKQYYTGTPA
jgi:hypothetical protein